MGTVHAVTVVETGLHRRIEGSTRALHIFTSVVAT